MNFKKFDTTQKFVIVAYLCVLVSFMWLPFKTDINGESVKGFMSVINIIIVIYVLKPTMHPFGFESMNGSGADLFFVWCLQLLSLYLKLFTGKTDGNVYDLSGIIFPTLALLSLSIILILDRKIYFTGKKIERNENDVF